MDLFYYDAMQINSLGFIFKVFKNYIRLENCKSFEY